MSNNLQPVNPPVIETITQTYTSFSVQVISITLNTSATFCVSLYDDNSKYITNKNMIMSGSDYQNWTSDAYVYTWVNQQLQQI
jgi:hypothetical protein